jgi:glycosyltransferase involved in cell wall biosynthesis
MLKILQIIPTLDRSGAEKQMALLAAGLPRERFTVEVAALTRLGPLEVELRAAGVPVTLIGKRLKLDLFALRRLVSFLKRRRFDVVHTWIFAANTYGRIAAHLAKVPVVVTSEMAVDLWKTRAHLRVDRWLARWTDRVVGNSQAVVEFYRKCGIAPEKLVRIYSGIGDEPPPPVPPHQTRQMLGVSPEAPVLLFAGRLAPQKGLKGLIDALDLLQHVQPGTVTLIAGEGPLRSALEGRARAFQLLQTGRVRFLGHREDVPALLAASDLLVLPSLYEGLPNVVLEAMHQAKPVVATDAPGTNELVVDGQTGWLVPVGEPKALALALRDLIRDPDRRAAMGVAGRARLEPRFDLATMIGEYADLYESLARARGRIAAT